MMVMRSPLGKSSDTSRLSLSQMLVSLFVTQENSVPIHLLVNQSNVGAKMNLNTTLTIVVMMVRTVCVPVT